jgi:DNA-binding MarR family transcriptional regulator
MSELHCHSPEEKANFVAMKQMWREKIQEFVGAEDTRSVEISGMIRRLSNIYDAIYLNDESGSELTGPRLGILFRLYVNELMSKGEGVTPTLLSHMQNVSKNTISSLIKGLEDQGLVSRENDTRDRRIYRLHLTDAGRSYVKENTPRHLQYINLLTGDLSSEEKEQLIVLLRKLTGSLIERGHLKRPSHPQF